MGTVENIVTTLTKMGHDKRGQASQRYNELSAWLSHEISLIRSLVESSPRNSSYGTASEGKSGGSSKGKGKMSIKTTSTTENSSKSTASSSSGNKSSKDTEKEKFQRQKRKSPETRQTGAYSESPDLKRNSLDYEELAVEAGLPADLNRLRKDQLINELEKRGCTNFTMKSLKKELIDGLRSALADCNRGEVDTSNTLVSQENISGTGKSETKHSFIIFISVLFFSLYFSQKKTTNLLHLLRLSHLLCPNLKSPVPVTPVCHQMILLLSKLL